MDTASEHALSFLYRLRGWVLAFAEHQGADPWPERDGRVAGALGAFELVGLLRGEEFEAWRDELLEPAGQPPAVSSDIRKRAVELLEGLLAAVPRSDEELAPELERLEGAFGALAQIGAVGAEWDQRMRDWLGRPSRAEEEALVRELNAGGTEQDLVAVLSGPPAAVEGVRVLYGLRFADGVSFVLQREQVPEAVDDWAYLDFTLRDDVGTDYRGGGGGGSDREQRVSFRTSPPPEASWLELVPASGAPIRIAL